MKRKKNRGLGIFYICLILFILIGCVIDSTVKYTVAGNIEFYDVAGLPISPAIGGSVKLFQPNLFCDSLTALQNKYSVRAEINPVLLMDHRLIGASLASGTISSNGNFSLTDILEGEYLLVYSVDGFGWHKQVCNVVSDMSLNLKMRETIVCDENYNTIDGTVVWGPDQHIVITEDFDILVNGSLTILENTVIEIANSVFEIIGELEISGSAELPVIITSNNVQPAKGDWHGLVAIDSGNCNLTNCIIQWANTGIDNKGNFESENIAILNILNYGIIFNNFGIVNNCTFYDCYGGIYGSWTKDDSGDIIINNCILMNNSFYGLQLHESSPNVTNCYFYGNEIHVISQENSYPLFEHCTFENSEEYAIYSEKEYNYNGEITISKCAFESNNILVKCNRGADISANDNNFITSANYAFKLSFYYGGNIVNAQYNYWNTTDEFAIQDLIYDETDEPGGDDVGIVDYSNWLLHKVSDAGVQL